MTGRDFLLCGQLWSIIFTLIFAISQLEKENMGWVFIDITLTSLNIYLMIWNLQILLKIRHGNK